MGRPNLDVPTLLTKSNRRLNFMIWHQIISRKAAIYIHVPAKTYLFDFYAAGDTKFRFPEVF